MESPDASHGLFCDSPNLFQEIVQNRIVLLQFSADEGVEVVSVKVGLGSFGEVFHRG